MSLDRRYTAWAYCGRPACAWVTLPVGPLCLSPLHSCWETANVLGMRTVYNLRIKRYAVAKFAMLSKTTANSILAGHTAVLIATFLCEV